ncbi:MAG TPA: glycosyltransferase family 39 protein [Candidatus Babeliales bacterium]|nr:glycosyltransferase family 39 protein [Candidatus Babeliales bacterium]
MNLNALKKSLPEISSCVFVRIGTGTIILMMILMGIVQVYAPFDQDEIEAVHTAWKIIHDGVIYRDFFQHHHPLLYYLLVPVIKLFGEVFRTLLIIRMIVFFQYFLIGLVTYFLSKRLFNAEIAMLSAYLLLTAMIFTKLLQIRPDGPQVLCGMISLLFLFNFFEQQKKLKRWAQLVISALFLSLSFLFLQKAIFLIAAIAVIFLLQVYKREISFLECVVYAVAFLAPIIGYFAYLSVVGAWELYYKFNWLLNAMHTGRFLPFYTLQLLATSQLLCACYPIGIFYYLETYYQKIIAWCSVWLLFAAIVIAKFSYAQYYAPAIPLMAMIAGCAIYKICLGNPYKMLMIMFALTWGSIIGNSYQVVKMAVKGINRESHEKINFVLNNAPEGSSVYDGKSFFNLFRHDIDFFWFEARMNHEKSDLIPIYERLTGNKYDVHMAIEKHKPVIISSYYIDLSSEFIVSNYERSVPLYDLFLKTTFLKR